MDKTEEKFKEILDDAHKRAEIERNRSDVNHENKKFMQDAFDLFDTLSFDEKSKEMYGNLLVNSTNDEQKLYYAVKEILAKSFLEKTYLCWKEESELKDMFGVQIKEFDVIMIFDSVGCPSSYGVIINIDKENEHIQVAGISHENKAYPDYRYYFYKK